MNHSQFKIEHLGKGIDMDGAYGHQCVDLVRAYALKVQGQKLGWFSGSAINCWKTGSGFIGLPYEKILNTREFIPQEGDICFFASGKVNGWNGHVGVVDKADIQSVTVINQNVGNGDGKGPDDFAKISVYDYLRPTRFLGVYRLIK